MSRSLSGSCAGHCPHSSSPVNGAYQMPPGWGRSWKKMILITDSKSVLKWTWIHPCDSWLYRLPPKQCPCNWELEQGRLFKGVSRRSKKQWSIHPPVAFSCAYYSNALHFKACCKKGYRPRKGLLIIWQWLQGAEGVCNPLMTAESLSSNTSKGAWEMYKLFMKTILLWKVLKASFKLFLLGKSY